MSYWKTKIRAWGKYQIIAFMEWLEKEVLRFDNLSIDELLIEYETYVVEHLSAEDELMEKGAFEKEGSD